GETPALRSAGVSPAIMAVAANGSLVSRIRVDGKFLARGGRRLSVQGVTYGPFAPNGEGLPFPTLAQARDGFGLMRAPGINAFRTYHVPPEGLLRLAEERGLSVFLDVPWGKHLCFFESATARQEAREAVRQAAQRGREHSCILAYSIGNEISPEIVR